MSVKIVLSTLCVFSLVSCQQTNAFVPGGFSIAHAVQNQEQALYWFTPKTFTLAASTSETEGLTQARIDFSADLKQTQTTPYQQPTDFSILLLAGSEGNHLSIDLSNPEAQTTLAQLVIVSPEENSQIFKGSFEDGQFNFSGTEPRLSAQSQTYLLAVNNLGEIESFSGHLAVAKNPPKTIKPDPSSTRFEGLNRSRLWHASGNERWPTPPQGFAPFDYPGFVSREQPDRARLMRMMMYLHKRIR